MDQFNDGPVILDEIQYVPQLFSYLKIRIDSARHKKGRFLMTGSQQFQLMKNISDSLAGRIAILELLPFSFTEIIGNSKQLGIAQRLWIGNYPDPVLNPIQRELWLSAYLRTYYRKGCTTASKYQGSLSVRTISQINSCLPFSRTEYCKAVAILWVEPAGM